MAELEATTEAAPAKVNLRLKVLAREAGGYHQIETLFCALELADEVRVERRGHGLALEVEGAEPGPPERNLVWRAAAAFYEAAGMTAGVRLRLRKRTPVGAGLGGGSSDAAATLRALSRLHGQPLQDERLIGIAARLGADVPFFLCGSPQALAWGRGERLLPLPPLPRRPVLVVAPDFAIATAEAYAALDAHAGDAASDASPEVHALERYGSWEGASELAHNDFEAATYDRFPDLLRVRDALVRAGARPAMLSGSGSALFGVFPDVASRDAAAERMAAVVPGARLIPTATAAASG